MEKCLLSGDCFCAAGCPCNTARVRKPTGPKQISGIVIGQTLTSPSDSSLCERNLACATLIRHKTLSDGKVHIRSHSDCTFCPIVIGQTLTSPSDSLLCERNLACTILIRHETLSNDDVHVRSQLYVLPHCRTTVPGSGLGLEPHV